MGMSAFYTGGATSESEQMKVLPAVHCLQHRIFSRSRLYMSLRSTVHALVVEPHDLYDVCKF